MTGLLNSVLNLILPLAAAFSGECTGNAVGERTVENPHALRLAGDDLQQPHAGSTFDAVHPEHARLKSLSVLITPSTIRLSRGLLPLRLVLFHLRSVLLVVSLGMNFAMVAVSRARGKDASQTGSFAASTWTRASFADGVSTTIAG